MLDSLVISKQDANPTIHNIHHIKDQSITQLFIVLTYQGWQPHVRQLMQPSMAQRCEFDTFNLKLQIWQWSRESEFGRQ
jgi:hypothetical protein